MPTDKQNRSRLSLLADQLHKHCKKHTLELFMMYSGDVEGGVKMSGHYSEQMVKNVIAHMAMNHPEVFSEVVEAINKMVDEAEANAGPAEAEVVEETPAPKLVVEP